LKSKNCKEISLCSAVGTPLLRGTKKVKYFLSPSPMQNLFTLVSKYSPSGDQGNAITELVENLKK
jgi:hypothetical protein